jgi:murein DD-endopeptidase MepM/ murein hydrolase activator NlpD
MARLTLALFLVIAPGVMAQESDSFTTLDGYSIPDLMSTFGAYPNPLELTEQDREGFHPVVIFPASDDIPVMDLRYGSDGIAPEEDRIKSKKEKSLWKRLQRAILNISRKLRKKPRIQPRGRWAVGKYDENRVGLYSTEMFEDTEHSIDGFAGQRTLHLGVDLNGPAGTKVYAFCDGVVHSAGYNSELGDYGNVVVIQHHITGGAKPRTVWALYGHMDAGTTKGKRPGTRILKGQVIGRVGDIHGELLRVFILYQLRMLLLFLLLNSLDIISRHPIVN